MFSSGEEEKIKGWKKFKNGEINNNLQLVVQ